MEKKEKAPVLRFKDTNGKDYPAWEQRKLEDCATIIMGQSPKSENYTNDPKDHILVQGNADLKNGQVAPRVWTTEVTKIGKVGDIILSVRAPVGEVGKTAYDVVLGRGVAAIRGNAFLLQTLLKLKECKYWGKVSAGSTFDSITSEILKSTLISMPAIEEQIKIGDFLSSVDKLITLHQRKLEALKKLKRTLLQKMFPKKGHLKPELRFFGFTNDWEQRKLEELASKFTGGGTPNTSNPNYWNGEIPWIQSSDLKEDDVLSLTVKKHISQEGLENSAAKIVPKNSLVIVTRVGVGKLVVNNQEIATSQDFLSLSGIKGDSRFLAYSLYSLLKKNSRRVQGTSIKGITKVDFLKETILIPSLEEQEKISSCMVEIDKLITLHQRKLEIYKKLKKGLLQKMFI